MSKQIDVTWSDPLDFSALDAADPNNKDSLQWDKPGLYLWLLKDNLSGESERWTIVYAGKTQLSLYDRNFHHIWNFLSGSYAVYYPNKDMRGEYESFIKQQNGQGKIKSGRTPFFFQYLNSKTGYAYWPNNTIDNFEQLTKSANMNKLVPCEDVRKRFYDALKNMKIVFGTVHDDYFGDLDLLESDLIFRLRKIYLDDFGIKNENEEFIKKDLQGMIAKITKAVDSKVKVSKDSWVALLKQIGGLKVFSNPVKLDDY